MVKLINELQELDLLNVPTEEQQCLLPVSL